VNVVLISPFDVLAAAPVISVPNVSEVTGAYDPLAVVTGVMG
jgi:hypothetical protein